MKLVFTVTAVYDFPDDVEIEDLVEGESLGRHIVVGGRKFQPFIDFSEYEENGEKPEWEESEDEELEEIYDQIDDSLEAEEYTVMIVDAGDADLD